MRCLVPAVRANWRTLMCGGLFALLAGLPAAAETSAPAATEASAAPVGVAQAACVQAKEPADEARIFVEERLGVWQRRLDLEDWKISIRMTPRDELKPKTLGGIRWDKRKRSAVIWVLHPVDYQLSRPEMLRDMERTVVHELLHLELSSRRRSQASRSHEENAVNRIAEAFLQLDREK